MRAANVVLDAWAALALLWKEVPAERVVRRYLKQAMGGRVRLLMNVVNLGEVYHRMIEVVGEEAAQEGLRRFRRLPIDIVAARESLVIDAARIWARHPLSYEDAFAVATARAEKASLLTGDPEIVALPRSVARVVRLERSRP